MTHEELIEKTKESINDLARFAIESLDESVEQGRFKMKVLEETPGTYTAAKILADYLLERQININTVKDTNGYDHQFVLKCKRLKKSISLL